eukprot:CAMPEP_0113866772 /NCGR_PEP_ID=MMETSP0780_2-20120614/52_1 /TAXON_ID=652834 /ORGANISM="Palpitomonas bilix" /LENGTH=405 /DNA_ID=CAMNT_0000851647 /DNA_START=97 /DNA_END=1311 /DNA_ORIENTATION=- /assembly_acc=CAM_ASM_000599
MPHTHPSSHPHHLHSFPSKHGREPSLDHVIEDSFGHKQKTTGKGGVDISHGGVGKRRLPHSNVHHYKRQITARYSKLTLQTAGASEVIEQKESVALNYLACPSPVRYQQAPDHLQDNEYIKTGYRTNYSFWHCVKSLFFLHNETVNIWTHLLGLVLFILLAYTAYNWELQHPDDNLRWFTETLDLIRHNHEAREEMWRNFKNAVFPKETVDRVSGALAQLNESLYMWNELKMSMASWASEEGNHIGKLKTAFDDFTSNIRDEMVPHQIIFAVFFFGAFVCMLGSVLYHTFFPVVQTAWGEFFMKLDYVGICLMIAGSSCVAIFYALYCFPFWKWFYIGLMAVLCGGTTFVTFDNRFSSPAYRPFRAMCFIACGSAGVIPVAHEHFLYKDGIFSEGVADLNSNLVW